MTHIFRHPKYYKELRKQYRDSIEALPRNGESLVLEEAPSLKLQAASLKLSNQPSGAPSSKPQAPSYKPQASSHKQQAP